MPGMRTALVGAAAVAAGPALAVTVSSGAGEGLSAWRLAAAFVLVVPPWFAGRLPLPVSVPLASVVVGLAAAVVVDTELWVLVNAGLTLIAGVIVPWFAGRYRRRGRALLAAERERADRARRDERERLATTMHDGLGHDLTLLTVRLGALEVDASLAPDHREELAALRRRATDAVERLQDVVDVLGGHAPVPEADAAVRVRAVVAGARDDGLAIRGWDAASDRLLAAMAPDDGAVVVRVVREGVTNAARHAPGAAIDLTLARDGHHVAVTVRNEPGGDPARPGRAGRGLADLRRAVTARGGTLETGDGDRGGFALVARLPSRCHGEVAG